MIFVPLRMLILLGFLSCLVALVDAQDLDVVGHLLAEPSSFHHLLGNGVQQVVRSIALEVATLSLGKVLADVQPAAFLSLGAGCVILATLVIITYLWQTGGIIELQQNPQLLFIEAADPIGLQHSFVALSTDVM